MRGALWRAFRPVRMWRFPYACEVVVLGEARWRVTWERTRILHRRRKVIGIERWSAPLVPGSGYAYTVWGRSA